MPAKRDVALSVLLERVTQFHVQENCYSAVWWVVLSWRDPAAAEAVAASTGAYLQGNGAGSAAGGCARPCDSSQLAAAGCCDGMWLPHIEMPNLVEYTQDQLPRYRISVDAGSGLVTWSTRLVGKWHAPLDFRAYPFDHQHLLLELAIAESQAGEAGLVWEHVAKLNNTAHTKGADLSGWRIVWAKGKLYDSRSCHALYGITAPRYAAATNLGEPGPANTSGSRPAVYTPLRLEERREPDARHQGHTSPPDCGSYDNVYDEARALYGPVVLVADIMIKRVASYYVISNLLPVLIISIMVFVVFYMPCDALGDRLVVVMTLLLALTALQFVFDFPPANYINALQQMVLVSYVMMFITCIESLIVNRIVVLPQQLKNTRACRSKYEKVLRHLTQRNQTAAPGTGPGRLRAASSMRPAGVSLQRKPSGANRGKAGLGTRVGVGVGVSGSSDSSSTSAQLVRLQVAVVSEPHPPRGAGALGEREQQQQQRMDQRQPPLPPPPPPPPQQQQQQPPVGAGLGSRRVTPAPQPPPDAAVISVSGPAPVAEALQHSHDEDFAVDSRRPSSNPRYPAIGPAGGGAEGGSVGRRRVRLWWWLWGCWMALRSWGLALVGAPAGFYLHCKEDPDFAWFVASRVDKWCCVVCFVLYGVAVSVLMWVQTQVGDHKLMLGNRPGNM